MNQTTNPPVNQDAKRQALTGQWRTPPLPVFAASSGGTTQMQQQQQQVVQHVQPPLVQQQQPVVQQQQHVTFNPTSLPDSSEDYAKALQEAYRRGAEAAAAMNHQNGGVQPQQAQQQQQVPVGMPMNSAPMPPPPSQAQLSTAVSCPNLGNLQVPQVATTTQQHPPPPLGETGLPVAQQQQPPVVPNPLLHAPAPAQAATMTTTTAVVEVVQQQQQQPVQPPPSAVNQANRSLSLPDMTSFAARAQAEEEKRKKRLARNRASARLRRLRKKNLVDSYEGEVGVLESSLQKLKAHEWGTSQDHEALLEALSMERGQQVLSKEERSSLITEILQQQRTQVEWIKECQLEQLTLQWLSALSPEASQQDELAQELQSVLQLSDEQKSQILQATKGLETEVQSVETLEDCLSAMQHNDWLLNEGVSGISNQFTSILHPNQVSKYLLWTDANADSIESLDYCHAPRNTTEPACAPIFGFGMDGDYGGGGGGAPSHQDQDKQ